MKSFNDLPEELKVCIVSFFNSPQTLLRFGRVSKEFNRISQDEQLWRELVHRDITVYPKLSSGETYKDFYKKTFQEVLMQIKQLNRPFSHGIHLQKSPYKDRYPLEIACELGFEALVDWLIRQNPDDDILKFSQQLQIEKKSSLLHFAIESSNFLLVSKLMDYGFSNAINELGNFKRTALHVAVEHPENSNIVELLLENDADVEARDTFSRIALHLAAQVFGNAKVVELLLNKKNDCDALDKFCQTPLIFAAQNGDVATVELLLKYGAHEMINLRDTLTGHKMTALHRTISEYSNKNDPETKQKYMNVVKLLLDHGAGESLDIEDYHGKTPLDYADEAMRELITKCLSETTFADRGLTFK